MIRAGFHSFSRLEGVTPVSLGRPQMGPLQLRAAERAARRVAGRWGQGRTMCLTDA